MNENLTVFYWLNDDRIQRLGFGQIFNEHCSSKGINLKRLNFSSNNEHVEGGGLFIHKLSDLIHALENGNNKEEAKEQLNNYEKWIKANPQIDVIDELSITLPLLDRFKTAQIINEICFKVDPNKFFIPPFCQILSSQQQVDASWQLAKNNVKFPIICKPISISSHENVVVTSIEGLASVSFPCIAQSIVAHSGVYYKIFVIGDQLYCLEHSSLPDPSQLMMHRVAPAFHFNTKTLAKDISKHFHPNRSKSGRRPTSEELQTLAKALRHEIKMELFGADLLVDSDSDRIACIDVNPFPGYRGIPDFHSVLSNFFIQRWKRQISFEMNPPIFIEFDHQ